MKKIVFFDADKITCDYLKKHLSERVVYQCYPFDINSDETINAVPKDAEIISIFPHSETIKADVLDLFPKLELILTRSTGYNHIDLGYMQKRGIRVANVPNYGEITVAEFTIGLMISLLRKVYQAKSDMKKNSIQMEKYIGEDLNGKVLGVVGTGAIGRAVIRLAQAFGVRIVAYDPCPSLPDIKYVELDELLSVSDIITLHCPATNTNNHLLNKSAFNKMKTGVYIINTARGSLIETESLYEELKNGKIAGVALDVLENEDVLTQREVSIQTESFDALADSVVNLKMMQLENVIITPHIAFNSVDAIHRILKTTLENMQNYLNQIPFYEISQEDSL